jgi:hypothetical protein
VDEEEVMQATRSYQSCIASLATALRSEKAVIQAPLEAVGGAWRHLITVLTNSMMGAGAVFILVEGCRDILHSSDHHHYM